MPRRTGFGDSTLTEAPVYPERVSGRIFPISWNSVRTILRTEALKHLNAVGTIPQTSRERVRGSPRYARLATMDPNAGVSGVSQKAMEVRMPRPTRVKNKTPADRQVRSGQNLSTTANGQAIHGVQGGDG